MPSSTTAPPTLPLVGRANELATLGAWLDDVAAGRGGTMIVAGGGGVGKTRLAAALAERATRQGWAVALGQAYPVETGVPYAIFGDALLPFFRRMEPAALAVLTRGGSAELAYICLKELGVEPVAIFNDGAAAGVFGMPSCLMAEHDRIGFDLMIVATFDDPAPILAALERNGIDRERLVAIRESR